MLKNHIQWGMGLFEGQNEKQRARFSYLWPFMTFRSCLRACYVQFLKKLHLREKNHLFFQQQNRSEL